MIYYFYLLDNVIYYTKNVNDIPENVSYQMLDVNTHPSNVIYIDNTFKEYDELFNLQLEKRNKLNLLKQNFDTFTEDGFMYSNTLSCYINFGSSHLRNVDSLISLMENINQDSVLFRVYDNSFKNVSLQELRNIKLELIQFGLKLYQIKWYIENLMQNAQTKEDLENIVIDFSVISENKLYGL